jgi:SOS-response transcriptional repressor LexA
MKHGEKIITSSKSLDKEFYNIPLFGEVKIEDKNIPRNYDIGEIVTNSRNSASQSLNVRAADDALSRSGIFSGDFLTVHLNRPLKNNDIAVIQLGHKIYIRKIFFEKKRVRLETDSDTPSPLIIDPTTPGFRILGKVITVIREL